MSKQAQFISLRWRMTLPLVAVLMVVAMLGAYAVAGVLTGGYRISEENVLLQSTEGVLNRAVDVYEQHYNEAIRIAYTQGISESVRLQEAGALHTPLESMAQVSDLDVVVLVGGDGVEVVGLVRVVLPDRTDYSVSTATFLMNEPVVQQVLAGAERASGLLVTSEGVAVVTAVPVVSEGERVGTVVVGQHLERVLQALQSSAVAEVSIYGADGRVLATTFDLTNERIAQLALDSTLQAQLITDSIPLKTTLTLQSIPYQIVYAPLTFGENRLGVIGVALPNTVPFVSAIGRQMTALFAAALAGTAVILVFVGVHRFALRLDRVTATAEALTAGQAYARTGMKATDEIGVMAQALDQFATQTQEKEDKFRTLLRRERRERAYLLSVLEGLPDGVLVQDSVGQILMMNDRARQLLGTQARQFTLDVQAMVTEVLGTALAPGIYALGKPQHIEHHGTMLSAQAGAVVSPSQERLGTVVILRDITEQVRQERAREQLLAQLQEEAQHPLETVARAPQPMMSEFAREIARHSASLQKMIVDMRELTRYTRTQARQIQRALSVETLLWAVANDWRQIAQATHLTLKVELGTTGLFVLGDESRLRLALGNIVDNAIKYTPSGGTIVLEIKESVEGAVHLRVRDNGAGIGSDDLPHVFMPFYRGTPIDSEGQMIRVPGMGQGLPIAKQLIEAHGGIIRVKSKPQVGTAVYVALPLTAGVGYTLPRHDADMLEGDTVIIPDNVDIESYWRR